MQDILDISVYGFAYINGFENGKLKVKYLLALYCVVAKMARSLGVHVNGYRI